ncbi:MAG: hypothetical protein RJQ08_03815 [Salinisphaeraceae bacterium]
MENRNRPGPKPQHGAKIEVRLPPELKDRALAKAEAEGVKLSDRLRQLIAAWLDG